MKTRRIVISTVLLVGGLLSIVQVMPKNPLLIGERLFPYGGWIQVILAMLYGGWLCYKMQNRQERPKWRKRAWLLFSIVFFGQLVLGIFADPIFLMTGKLHLPIPAVILAGPLYRFEGLFMPYFLSAPYYYPVPLGVASFVTSGIRRMECPRKIGTKKVPLSQANAIQHIISGYVGAILLRIFGASGRIATAFGIAVGVIGLLVMLLFSRKRRKMVHCSSYCPIGTLVSFLKYLSPFRYD